MLITDQYPLIGRRIRNIIDYYINIRLSIYYEL